MLISVNWPVSVPENGIVLVVLRSRSDRRRDRYLDTANDEINACGTAEGHVEKN